MSEPRIDGLDELLRDFGRLAEAVRGEALKAAGMAMALPVETSAKGKAPKRTRNLGRSIHWEVLEADDTHVLVGVGTDVEYAAVQEFGGTIVPKERQFLAVPLTEAARALENARDFAGLKVRMARGGQGGALVDESGVAQYALVKSVTIPAQPYLRPALDENRDEVKREAAEVLRQKIREAV